MKTPLMAEYSRMDGQWLVYDADGFFVASAHGNKDNALAIVEAVNAYAAQQQAAQVRALADALRPLAAIADAYPDSYPDRAIGWEFVTAGGERLRLTLGDARKAAAALKAVEGKEATP